MKNSIHSLASSVKNQKLRLSKLENVYSKSMENIKILNEDIANQTNTITSEQAKLKDNIDSLLLHLKEILLNSTAQQSNFLLKANEFHQNFESVLSCWKQHSTGITTDFCNFVKESVKNCHSLETKLCLELKPLNSAQDKIINIGLKNKEKIAQMIACCTSKIQMSLETCIKLLYEILCLLEIVQTKMKEQLKTLESTISYCTKERLQFLNNIFSSTKSIHQYFIEQSEFLKQIKSNAIDQRQELEMNVNKEFLKIKEALVSIQNLFNLQQKFSFENWNQMQGHLLKTKHICEDSALLLRQCSFEDQNLLDKLEQQCTFNYGELQSLLKDETGTIAISSEQLLDTFDEVNSEVKNFSEEKAKRRIQLENDIKDGLQVQNEEVRKHIKTAQLLVEDIMQYINEGLQNTRNSALSVGDLATNKDVNNTILELKNNVTEYVSKFEHVMERNDSALQVLPEITKKKIENPEELLEFNHEELLSSTPSSHVEKSKCVIDEKMKLLNKVKKVVAMHISQGNKSCSNLDGNESVMSLPNIGLGTKKVFPERTGSRSFVHKRFTK